MQALSTSALPPVLAPLVPQEESTSAPAALGVPVSEPAVVVQLSPAAQDALSQQQASGVLTSPGSETSLLEGASSSDSGDSDSSEERERDEEMQMLRGDLRKAREKEKAEKAEKKEAEEASGEGSPDGLSEGEREEVAAMKARDREVRSHEMAHVAAAGGHAGTPVYETELGPDGNAYAIGGHVSIDASAAGSPEATLAKMQTVRAAAMAPGDPSGADRSVAAAASAQAAEARANVAKEAIAETEAAAELRAMEKAEAEAAQEDEALELASEHPEETDPGPSPQLRRRALAAYSAAA